MNVVAAPKTKVSPVIISVGYNLYIKSKKGKFGLYDQNLRVNLLEAVYDQINLYPATTYLWVHKDGQVGVFDVLLRIWLVPLQFTQIYLTQAMMLFVVFDGPKKGMYDGTLDKLIWA